jgi:AcrR family transcriptional regulator
MTPIRSQQRVTTQRKILQTARKLFLASSFDSVGVREIAAEAGVATGTVIAAFGSKVDLLHAIVIEDLDEQLVLMKLAAASADRAFDRICKLCKACINHQSGKIAIVRASMADSWLRSDVAENKIRKAIKPMHQVVVDELLRGIERGEIRADLNVKLGANLILESLLNTYRLPLYEDVPHDDLGKMMFARLDIIMRGYSNSHSQLRDACLVVQNEKELTL